MSPLQDKSPNILTLLKHASTSTIRLLNETSLASLAVVTAPSESLPSVTAPSTILTVVTAPSESLPSVTAPSESLPSVTAPSYLQLHHH